MATLNLKILPNRRKLSGKLGIYVSLTFKKEVRAQFENLGELVKIPIFVG